MANTHRGEFPLTLNVGGRDCAFAVRLTYNGSCNVTTAMTVRLGREYAERDIVMSIAKGSVPFVLLRQLLFESIKGQHGVKTVEQVGDLLDDNKERILLAGQAVAQAFNSLFPEHFEGVEGDEEGKPSGGPN